MRNSKPITFLGLNPGARYLGLAVFKGPELIDWGIKAMKGRWSAEKVEKIKQVVINLIDRYEPDVLAIKKLHPSRSSFCLNKLTDDIKELSEKRGVKVYQFSIETVEAYLSPKEKINKEALAELMSEHYPVLFPELKKEEANMNRYYIRMFEAVAMGYICFQKLDRKY